MRIKRLDITGFKSFVDRTVVEFDGGITAIVGPNGCGKSNLVDAIQWACGEQSPKQLRGREMTDVIFAGSEDRAPVGLAEVTLTFSNEKRTAPPQFNEYSEIQITRRLFRSGESEYLLNKTPCRLRDIQEFLMDAGVGKGSVSVIQQGKIGLIVGSPPAERRVILEEAAGISKYKTKKRQALSKMDATEQNLMRVRDVLGELERQMRSLNRQAKKAERYRTLKEDIRELELKLGARDFQAFTKELVETQQSLQLQEQQETGVVAQLAGAEGAIAADRLSLTEEEKALSDGQQKLAELKSLIQREEQQLEYDQDRVRELAQRAETTQQEAAKTSEEASETDGDVLAVTEELAGAQEAWAVRQEQIEEEEGLLNQCKEELESLTLAVENARSEIVAAMQSVSNGQNQLVSLDKRKEELDIRLTRIRGECQRLEEVVSGLREQFGQSSSQLDQSRQVAGQLEEKHSDQVSTLAKFREGLAVSQENVSNLREDLANKRSRLISLEELQSNFEGYAEGARSIMLRKDEGVDDAQPQGSPIQGLSFVHPQAGAVAALSEDDDRAHTGTPLTVVPGGKSSHLTDKIFGLVADVMEVPKEWERAVAGALGQSLQSILVSSAGDAQEAIEFLKNASGGRGVFIPKNLRVKGRKNQEVPKAQGVIGPLSKLVSLPKNFEHLRDYLLADVLVVEDLPSALAIWQGQDASEWRLVTRAGEVVESEGVITGGTQKDLGAGLLERRRQIAELSEEVEARSADLRVKEQEVRDQVSALTECEEALARMSQNSQDQGRKVITLERDHHGFELNMEQEQRRLDELNFEVTQGQAGLNEVHQEKLGAEALMESGKTQQSEAEARLNIQQGKLGETTRRQDEVHANLITLKVEVASLTERRDALAEKKERLSLRSQDLGERLERLVDSGSEALEERTSLIQSSGQRSNERESSLEEALELEEALRVRRLDFDAQQSGLQGRESGIRGIRSNLEEVRKLSNALSLKEAELSMKLEHVATQILEKYQEDLESQAEQWLDPTLDVDAAQEVVAEVREQISKMGEVNVTAIDEFAEVTERHEFLSKQKDDLESTLAQLNEAINKINKTTRKRFEETFEAVNAQFQEVFPRMFRGGRAALVLTEPHNILDSGVDIVVQPPGKKLQNINLLSGGEKALTAASLIVAIFMVRPTPYCLLDEVDAPLDDANVGRFNELITEMSETSQFIVITHNKGTMQVSNCLYGVTMETPGVSKLVGVKFAGSQGGKMHKSSPVPQEAV